MAKTSQPDPPACIASRLDLIGPVPDAPLTTLLEGLAAFAATVAGAWGLPVSRPEPRREVRLV